MDDAVTEAVLRALDLIPCSQRSLAVAADVPHSTLVRIRSGELGASPAVATALAAVLQRWAADCQKAADAISQAGGHLTIQRPARRRRKQEE
jgi:hypothetical protein